jgi:hypothetical protein
LLAALLCSRLQLLVLLLVVVVVVVCNMATWRCCL